MRRTGLACESQEICSNLTVELKLILAAISAISTTTYYCQQYLFNNNSISGAVFASELARSLARSLLAHSAADPLSFDSMLSLCASPTASVRLPAIISSSRNQSLSFFFYFSFFGAGQALIWRRVIPTICTLAHIYAVFNAACCTSLAIAKTAKKLPSALNQY